MFKLDKNTLNITAELLGISDVKVIEVKTNVQKNEIIIRVRSNKNSCRVASAVNQQRNMELVG